MALLKTIKEQVYLIKQVYEHKINNLVGSQTVDIETMGMVSSWMWFFQRSDIDARNEWSNYTNWKYESLPHGVKDPGDLSELNKLETNETNIKIQIKSFENSSDNNDWINKYLSLHSEKILEES